MVGSAIIRQLEAEGYSNIITRTHKELDLTRQDLGDFVNVGTGKDISIKDLAHLMAEIIGYKGGFSWDTSKPNGTPRKLLDVSRINSLGWSAKTSLWKGIGKTYNWYCENL